MRKLVVFAKKMPTGETRLVVTDNVNAVKEAGSDPVFQADSVWVDVGSVVTQVFVKESGKKNSQEEVQPEDSFEHQLARIMTPIKRRSLKHKHPAGANRGNSCMALKY